MKFTPSSTDDESNLALLKSENGAWEIRLDRVVYGCRIRARKSETFYYSGEYCAGASRLWQAAIMDTMVKVMERQSEDIAVYVLEKIWPDYVKKPMCNDPICWLRLATLSGMSENDALAFAALDNSALDLNPHSRRHYEAISKTLKPSERELEFVQKFHAIQFA